jgi:hypothetical protein
MTTLRDKLVTLARAYASVKGRGDGLALSGISTKIFNDGKTLDRIANGGDLVTGNYERALQWFSDNWPDELDWPASIARPSASPKEAA